MVGLACLHTLTSIAEQVTVRKMDASQRHA
jgi:hypothetical protein